MFLGDMCKLKILRQGEVMTVEVKLDLVTSLVPTQLYDKRPRYVLTDCNTRHTQVSAWPSVDNILHLKRACFVSSNL